MPLADFCLAINAVRQSVGLDLASPRAQAHGPAEFLHSAQLTQFVNHSMWRGRIEFARICVLQTTNVARKFNAGRLHPEANAEIRNLLLTRISDRLQHTFNPALPKSSRYQNSVVIAKLLVAGVLASFQAFGLNPAQAQSQIMSESTV